MTCMYRLIQASTLGIIGAATEGISTYIGGSTKVEIGSVLTIGAIVFSGVWWLSWRLKGILDKLAELEKRFDGLPCNAKECPQERGNYDATD